MTKRERGRVLGNDKTKVKERVRGVRENGQKNNSKNDDNNNEK